MNVNSTTAIKMIYYKSKFLDEHLIMKLFNIT